VLQADPEPNPKVFSYEMCCAGMARHSVADSHGETSVEVYDGYCYMGMDQYLLILILGG